jgi:hypothetical protein
MKHKRACLLLICALSTTTPAPASADAIGDMISVMFRMMLYMMSGMADSMDSSNSWGMPMNSMGLGMTGWPAMSGLSGLGGWPMMSGLGGWPGSGFGSSPWLMPMGSNAWGYPMSTPGFFNNPYSGGAWGYPGNRRWPGAGQPDSARMVSASLLDGKWYGTTGETLEVRGNRFRLRSGRLSVNGILNIDNNLVRLYTPQTGAVQIYQFARDQTSLVLKDTQGNTLKYYLNPRSSGFPVRIF